MREQFWKHIFWGSNFEDVFFEGTILKKCFWNVFFEEEILKIYFSRQQFWKCVFWGENFDQSKVRLGWNALGDQWSGMVYCKSHKYFRVDGRVPKVSWLTVFGKGRALKNWILEQPVNNTGCSSIQALLRETF